MIKMVTQFFWWMDNGEHSESPVTDPTVYRIETISHTYCGQILFQDDVQLKLKAGQGRPVKVLKQNIVRISIVKQEKNGAAHPVASGAWKQP